MKQHTLRKRAGVVAATAAALALALTGCSGSAPQADNPSATDGGELTTVNVGNLVYIGTAPFQLGIEQGFFEEEGLDIVVTEGDSPAALGGQLTSGQLDISFTTGPFLASAVSEGADLRAFASVDGVIDPDDPSSAVLVAADSPITGMADLEGKKVAIPAIGSLLWLATVAAIDSAGVDPDTVELVQVPFPQMQQALEQGNVDAIVPTEPFMSAAVSAGMRSIGNPEADTFPGASVTAWAASLGWLEANPETAAAFVRAMNRSIEFADANREVLLEMMPAYSGLSADQISEMSFGTQLTTELNTRSIEDQAKLLAKFGGIAEAPPLEDLVYEVGQ